MAMHIVKSTHLCQNRFWGKPGFIPVSTVPLSPYIPLAIKAPYF